MIKGSTILGFLFLLPANQVLSQQLVAVLVIDGVAHVEPPLLGLAAGFQDELVEVAVFGDEINILLHLLLARHGNIGSFSQFVLAPEGTSHRQIEQMTPVSAGDRDGTKPFSERFEDVLA